MSIELAPDDDYEAEPVNLAPSRTWHNASTKPGSYTPPKWPVRSGANDHQGCKSRTKFNSTAGEV